MDLTCIESTGPDQTQPEEYEEQLEPVEEPIENSKELNRKRLVLKLYYNEFPNKLERRNIDMMSMEELELLQQEFENSISLSTSVEGMSSFCMKGIQGLEMGLNLFTPINCQGLYEICDKDDNFKDDIKLLCLRYADSVNTSPEMRVGFSLVSSIMLLHKLNSMKQSEISQDFNDLDDNFI